MGIKLEIDDQARRFDREEEGILVNLPEYLSGALTAMVATQGGMGGGGQDPKQVAKIMAKHPPRRNRASKRLHNGCEALLGGMQFREDAILPPLRFFVGPQKKDGDYGLNCQTPACRMSVDTSQCTHQS